MSGSPGRKKRNEGFCALWMKQFTAETPQKRWARENDR
jgi:hypothetical protein